MFLRSELMSKFLSTPSARRATAGANEQHSISKFLSTPSARRATFKDFYNDTYTVISIHALREEGDGERHWAVGTDSDFYPRPPRGGRRYAIEDVLLFALISIHALREEGDASVPDEQPHTPISIHALREEGDNASNVSEGW